MENTIVITTLLVLYIALWVLTSAINELRPGIIRYQWVKASNLRLLNALHVSGLTIMFLPFFLIKHLPVDLLTFPDQISLSQAIAFLGFFALIALLPWNKANNNYRDVDTISFSTRYRIFLYAAIRVCFLVGYEWFFRGLLLTAFCVSFGNVAAIGINVVLYVSIHIQKSRKELIGCLPLGILLCVFTLWWGSVWPAIIFHLQISLLNEWPRLQQFISPQKQTAI